MNNTYKMYSHRNDQSSTIASSSEANIQEKNELKIYKVVSPLKVAIRYVFVS